MRDKQIEEMARVIEKMPWRIEQDGLGCRITNNTELAKYFYNAGYCKASDVAMKIFEEIEKIEKRLLNRQKKCDKEAQKAGWYLEVREAYEGQSEGIGLCLDYLAELKKKYESEGEG